MIKKILLKRITIAVMTLLVAGKAHAQHQKIINPGEVWPDNRGEHIQAHGGGIIKIKNTYYWYGEEKAAWTGFK
ncbi:hypothetical protein ACFJIV_02080 [Mucilaginibacter sp. UC70_90]